MIKAGTPEAEVIAVTDRLWLAISGDAGRATACVPRDDLLWLLGAAKIMAWSERLTTEQAHCTKHEIHDPRCTWCVQSDIDLKRAIGARPTPSVIPAALGRGELVELLLPFMRSDCVCQMFGPEKHNVNPPCKTRLRAEEAADAVIHADRHGVVTPRRNA